MQLLDWLNESEDNNRCFRQQQEIWHRLHPAYSADEIDVDKAAEKITYRTKIRHRGIFSFLNRFVNIWSKVAAVLLLPLVVAILFLLAGHNDSSRDMVTLATAYGCNSQFTLPDGSEVWLNSNSTLQYIPNAKDCRNVFLTGEAFFSVHSDKKNRFTVNTSDMKVVCTGTQFNVNAYDSVQSVTLAEGKISVAAADKEWQLKPGEHLTLAASGVSVNRDVDIDRYCSWRRGMLIFNDEPISLICTRLQQLFNVNIDLDPAIADKQFHIILNGEDIHEFIYLLQLSEEVECEMEEDSAGIDSPPRITIRRKA